jgi:hypothetical protein
VVMVLGDTSSNSFNNSSSSSQEDIHWEDTSCMMSAVQLKFDVAPICQSKIDDTRLTTTTTTTTTTTRSTITPSSNNYEDYSDEYRYRVFGWLVWLWHGNFVPQHTI